MIYSFQCRACGRTKDSTNREPFPCNCGSIYKRKFSFQFKPPMQEHFNYSVGKPVSSEQQFKDELKRASEAQSKRLGMDVNYVPVDPSDRKAVGVTDEGLDSQKKAWAEMGKPVGAN